MCIPVLLKLERAGRHLKRIGRVDRHLEYVGRESHAGRGREHKIAATVELTVDITGTRGIPPVEPRHDPPLAVAQRLVEHEHAEHVPVSIGIRIGGGAHTGLRVGECARHDVVERERSVCHCEYRLLCVRVVIVVMHADVLGECRL